MNLIIYCQFNDMIKTSIISYIINLLRDEAPSKNEFNHYKVVNKFYRIRNIVHLKKINTELMLLKTNN